MKIQIEVQNLGTVDYGKEKRCVIKSWRGKKMGGWQPEVKKAPREPETGGQEGLRMMV